MIWGMPMLMECDSVEENAALCRRLGLDFVELNLNLPVCRLDTPAERERLRAVAGRYGIGFTLHLDESLNPADFNEAVARAYGTTVRRMIRAAEELEIPILTMHLSRGVHVTLPDRRVYLFERYRDRYLRRMTAFRELCRRAAGGAELRICVENTDGFLSFQREAVELLLECGAFGLTYDIGHAHGAGYADEPFLLSHADRLCHFHIHDAVGRQNHRPLGTGEAPLPEKIALARQYRCRCVLEVKTADALGQSAAWLRDCGLL